MTSSVIVDGAAIVHLLQKTLQNNIMPPRLSLSCNFMFRPWDRAKRGKGVRAQACSGIPGNWHDFSISSC